MLTRKAKVRSRPIPLRLTRRESGEHQPPDECSRRDLTSPEHWYKLCPFGSFRLAPCPLMLRPHGLALSLFRSARDLKGLVSIRAKKRFGLREARWGLHSSSACLPNR